MASLFKVKALYEFEAKEEDDLGFPGGQIIDVTEEVDDNWLEGKYTDAAGVSHAGIFPREFVEKYEPPLPARPTRPTRKQDAPTPAPAPVAPVAPREPEPEEEEEDEAEAPPIPVISKPQSPPTVKSSVEAGAPPPTLPARDILAAVPEAASAPRPAAESSALAPSAKKPPPVAAKSNAFKDRIAAFNQGGAAPVAPLLPGKPRANEFIKKPFVPPPPSSNFYVPPPKVGAVPKPYIREEDPEIIQKQEDDRAAAEAVGLTSEPQEDGEEAPKPTSLKERIALLQQQQLEQAQRASVKKPAPARKASEPAETVPEVEDEIEESGQQRSREPAKRQSLDVARDRPRVPSAHRRPPEPSAAPPVPEHDVSDGNEADQSAAGETTEDDTGTIGPEDSDETYAPLPTPRAADAPLREADVGDEEDTTETGEEEEEEIDEEMRRKMELRERMAKMSGGFGMPGMINPLAGLPTRAPPPRKPSKKTSEEAAPTSPPIPPQRVPVIPIPGMPKVQSPGMEEPPAVDEDDDDDEMAESRGAPPPVPRDSRPPPLPPHADDGAARAAPPIPTAARPSNEGRSVLPLPTQAQPLLSPDPGSESDDEASSYAPSGAEAASPLPPRPSIGGAPPIPGSRDLPPRPPQSPDATRRTSYTAGSGETYTSTAEKRTSRMPPPVPGSVPSTARPPPPPPPGTLSRSGTDLASTDDEINRRESDYEGDYDTDIASSAKHKDALKAHLRESSIDDGSTLADEPLSSPVLQPQAIAPRGVPPPPPAQGPPKRSLDQGRPPPPIPPPVNDDYDPYRADELRSPPPLPVASPAIPPPISPREAEESSADEDDYLPRPSFDNRAPPPPPQAAPQSQGNSRRSLEVNRAMSVDAGASNVVRPSLDVQRSPTVRRSGEQGRASFDDSSMAVDIPLNPETPWWTASQPLPPILQPRRNLDILAENEESTATKRGGQTVVTKNIYILFADYSETTISAKYDGGNPADCELQQSHKPAPARLRQDQLEAYWQSFGRIIAEKAAALAHANKKDAAVAGDGSPSGLVFELIKDIPGALPPIGAKSYGALVYENLGNATTQQFDEIRPGDIVTLRGARFEGHHGAMKTKYRQEYGPSHVAAVEEWDGTRRAIRIWEQGRDAKEKRGGVKSDKLRLGDLRSGEIRVWRVVGRNYVGW